MTQNIVSSLALELSDQQRVQLSRHYTKDPEAYDYFLRGQASFYGYSAENNARAREMYRRAIDRDPEFTRAVAALALTYAYDFRFGWNNANEASLKRARELSLKASKMDDTLPQVHLVTSVVHQFGRDHEGAIKAGQRAFALDPNYADAYIAVAFSQTHMGNAIGAIEMVEKAMRLNPDTPSIYYIALGRALFYAGRLEDAKLNLRRAVEMNPAFLEAHVMLAGAWSLIGDQDEAEWKAEEVLTLDPDFSVETWLANEPLVDPTYIDTLSKALSKAGLPEKPVQALPDKPSIAVLPFTNMSGDPAQEYFVDGITEDLITDLSKISGLFVIARNSVFSYKERPWDISQVAEELGIRYALKGSVRRADNQLRINAQLIDATTGGHLWADRYDGALDNVFALQDQVTENIVTALSVKLTPDEAARATESRQVVDSQVYDNFLRGWENFQRRTPEHFSKAISFYDRAIQVEPDYREALAAMAALYWEVNRKQWYAALGLGSSAEVERLLDEYLERALRNPTPLAFVVSADRLMRLGQYDQVLSTIEQALELAHSSAEATIGKAEILTHAGNPQEALNLIPLAERLDPLNQAYYAYVRGLAEFSLVKYEAATVSLSRALDLNPAFQRPAAVLAASYGQLGRKDDALTARRIFASESLQDGTGTMPERNQKIEDVRGINSTLLLFPFKEKDDETRLATGLQKAGMPTGN